jgi:NADH pyrophosphatase NudC (nudix superfamily)
MKMDEYIRKDKAIDIFIEGDGDDEFTEGYNFAVNEYREKIRAIPAADVQPVKHGYWEEEDTMPYDNFVVCSECGMNLSHQNYTKEEWQESFRYCPNCGARMDGDTE